MKISHKKFPELNSLMPKVSLRPLDKRTSDFKMEISSDLDTIILNQYDSYDFLKTYNSNSSVENLVAFDFLLRRT